MCAVTATRFACCIAGCDVFCSMHDSLCGCISASFHGQSIGLGQDRGVAVAELLGAVRFRWKPHGAKSAAKVQDSLRGLSWYLGKGCGVPSACCHNILVAPPSCFDSWPARSVRRRHYEGTSVRCSEHPLSSLESRDCPSSAENSAGSDSGFAWHTPLWLHFHKVAACPSQTKARNALRLGKCHGCTCPHHLVWGFSCCSSQWQQCTAFIANLLLGLNREFARTTLAHKVA
mmetsp:Transcript_12471/g.29378  ORF Transcript_12471/g.29378 Transcript_12471/m.29378 type:complete len:231 (+) Transcript_12471:153-845(+)